MRNAAKANAVALRRVLPYVGNSTPRKLTLVALLGLWVLLEVGTAFYPQFSPPSSMSWIRYLALWIIAREHGIELAQVQGATGGNGGEEP